MARDYPKVPVGLKLRADVVELIDQKVEGPTKLFRSSGRAGWITELIHRELKLPMPDPNYRGGSKLELPLHHIDLRGLKPYEETIVLLGRTGRSVYQIAKYLNDKRILPPKGCASWHPQKIERILNRIIARQFDQVMSKK